MWFLIGLVVGYFLKKLTAWYALMLNEELRFREERERGYRQLF